MIEVTKKDIFGNTNTMMINTTEEKYQEWCINRPRNIQDFFTELTVDEREFLLTGLTPDKWAEIFR